MDSQASHECFHCGDEFFSIIDFNIHLETHNKNAAPSQGAGALTDRGGEPHECFHCGEGFYSLSDLDNHMKIHNTATTQTVIKNTSGVTDGFVNLTNHGEDPHECFHCGEEFSTEDLLNSHLVTQHQVKQHKCVQCGESFTHYYQLEAHELIHKDVSPKVRSDVEMMYRSYTNNTRPSTSATYKDEDTGSPSQTEYECTYCGKFFKNAGALSTHKLIHAAKQCHKCTYCTKIFIRPSDLKRHIVSHTGEKPHGCHLCPKKFAQTSALYQHMRMSHRTKPHICPYCGEGFDMMAALRLHKKTHFEDESYVVPQKKPYLSRRTEDGNLFKCAQCGDSFTEKSELDVHSQIHMSNTIEITPETGNGTFALDLSQPSTVGTAKCPGCSMMFDEEAELNRHMVICIPSALDLSTHVKKEKDDVTTKNVISNLGVVDLTLDDDEDDGADQYKCPRCDKSFHLEVELNAHLIMFHSTPDSHECFHCGEEFDIEDDLKLHILTTHNKTGLKHHECPDCDQTFLLLSDFEDHKKQKHPVCTVCGHKFTKKSSLERHMRVNHEQGGYNCCHCKNRFPTKAELQTHKETEHRKKRPSLNESSTSSQQPDGMNSDEVRLYKCLQCIQTFTTKPELYKHSQTHLYTNPEPTAYKHYSRNDISNPDNSEGHKETHSDVVDLTSDDNEAYKCSMCDNVYSREEELIVHMMMHPKREPFECAECGKRFVFEKDYRFHLRTHVKAEGSKKRHECSTCGKEFSQPGELKKHLLTHTGDKPHQCPVCPKRFASLEVLQRHQATHGAEPHKCQHCGAGFWQDHQLQRHQQKDCKSLQQGTTQNGNPPGPSEVNNSNILLPRENPVDVLVGKVLKANNASKPSPLSGKSSMIPQAKVTQKPPMMPIKKETYTCCGWSFMSEADMKVHELSHKVTVYKCVQCMQVFRSPVELETHIKTHNQASSPSKVPYNDDSSTSSTLTAPSTSYIEDAPTSSTPIQDKSPAENVSNRRPFMAVTNQKSKKDKRHKCPQCWKEFKTGGFLARHMRLHESQLLKAAQKWHRCNECGQKFLSVAGLRKHALTHTDTKPNQCPVCNENFNHSAKLFEHMATHESGKTHTCPHCGKTFKRSASLRSHQRMHTEEYEDLADFSENVDMPNVHIPNVHTPNIHTPNIHKPNILIPNIHAPKASTTNDAEATLSGMAVPYFKQEDATGHMCTYCGKNFKTENLLKKHFPKHMKTLSSTYYETKVKFDATGKELRTVTRIRKKRYKCYICYKMFRTGSDLVRHMMIHTGERPCKCSWCPEGFILLHSLKRHTVKYHKDVPPRDIDQLTKDIVEAEEALSKAKKTKYGKPGYLCCGIRFPSYLEIQHHWLVHKEEEAYACPHCELKFTKGFTRTKHIMKVHTATKPNCLDCGKEFMRFQDLITHMKTHEAQMEGAVPGSNGEPATTARVEVYTDVADSEPASTDRVEVYTDVDDVNSVLVKTEVIPDEENDPDEVPVLPRLDNILHTAPDPLLLKQEGGENSDTDVDPIDSDATEPVVDPIPLKKEASMDTTDDPSSPIDDSVLDSEPEEKPISLKKESKIDKDPDVDPPPPSDNAVPDTGADVNP